jgi:tRNA pseudouridine55 synthase
MINAVVVIDKPAGVTSHDVVNRVRRITGERSVGHLGTLDPMATGVLPMVMGRYTRLAQFFKDGVKIYEGEIFIGCATDTYDAEGDVVGPTTDARPSLDEIRRHLPALTGHILQTPPAFSAKKLNGVPAYKLARREKPVELKPVEVEVRRFEILSVAEGRARFVAEVSAGTYVRSLAHDLGQLMGCGAHLSALRRTQAGEFELSQAVSLDALAEYIQSQSKTSISTDLVNLSEYTLSDVANNNVTAETSGAVAIPASPYLHPRQILKDFPSVTAPEQTVAAIRNGRSVNLPEFSDAPLVKVFASQSLLLAVMQRVAGTLFQPRVVLYGSNEPLPPSGC